MNRADEFRRQPRNNFSLRQIQKRIREGKRIAEETSENVLCQINELGVRGVRREWSNACCGQREMKSHLAVFGNGYYFAESSPPRGQTSQTEK